MSWKTIQYWNVQCNVPGTQNVMLLLTQRQILKEAADVSSWDPMTQHNLWQAIHGTRWYCKSDFAVKPSIFSMCEYVEKMEIILQKFKIEKGKPLQKRATSINCYNAVMFNVCIYCEME